MKVFLHTKTGVIYERHPDDPPPNGVIILHESGDGHGSGIVAETMRAFLVDSKDKSIYREVECIWRDLE